MIAKNILPKVFFLFIDLLIMACNPSKTLYLSNKNNQAITLIVDVDSMVDKQSQESIFKDSLQGKRIERHSIVNFGEGDWNKRDIESLKAVLAKTTIQIDGTNERSRLPNKLCVAHYSLFVEELLVKFHEPKH